ncbi:hypothetical protein [Altererythrobacter sp. B11]|uniref:hypothetical protein n=1 Tax=Altererythrobacter sp. B11 TaxID=2060312 RepID=UPI000E5A311D|nr:hypothetical protein [Altererythrobacter sp. B11]
MNPEDLRPFLRGATQTLHTETDALYSRFEVGEGDGYARLLLAHLLAARQYLPLVSEFCLNVLEAPLPDYVSALEGDLADAQVSPHASRLGCDQALPAGKAAAAGFAYAVLGSRIGIASLMKLYRRTLPADHPAQHSRFLGDRAGLAAWSAFLAWSGDRAFDEDEREEAHRGAVAAFALFTEAADAAAQAKIAVPAGAAA